MERFFLWLPSKTSPLWVAPILGSARPRLPKAVAQLIFHHQGVEARMLLVGNQIVVAGEELCGHVQSTPAVKKVNQLRQGKVHRVIDRHLSHVCTRYRHRSALDTQLLHSRADLRRKTEACQLRPPTDMRTADPSLAGSVTPSHGHEARLGGEYQGLYVEDP